MSAVYLDASAVVKLFKPEPETAPLEAALAAWPTWMSAELVRVESHHAVHRGMTGGLERAAEVLSQIELVGWNSAIRSRAEMPFSEPLRALDAIHAASALSVRAELDAVFVYDAQLSAALVAEGLSVQRPGA